MLQIASFMNIGRIISSCARLLLYVIVNGYIKDITSYLMTYRFK